MNIFAYNPEVAELEKTFLSKGTLAGATVFTVKNSNSFAASAKVLVGEMSRERSEILTVASKTATSLTLSAALFPHDPDDPIYLLEFDKTKIYRSTTGEGGVYNLIATVDIDVDNADGKTKYEDPSALDSYFYKISHYDSVGVEETDLSAAMKATGFVDNTVGEAIMDVVARVHDKNFDMFSIEEWIAIMNDISSDLVTQAKRPYRFLKTSTLLDATHDTNYTPFPADLWKIDKTEVNSINPVGTDTFQPKKIPASHMRFKQSQTPLASDDVYEIAYDDFNNRLMFNPKARTDRIGAFNFYYYKTFRKFTSMADILETPNNLIYKLGMWREWYLAKVDEDQKHLRKAMEYDKKYNAEVMKLQREKNIEAGGPSGMSPDRKRYAQWGGRRYRQ